MAATTRTGPRIELNSSAPGHVDGRQLRAVAFQAVRLEYVADVLKGPGATAAGAATVVVGGGRGLLARGLAALGLDVVSVDPSDAATGLAREGDDRAGVRYVRGDAEELPLDSGAFAVAYYADTLEITSRPDQVAAEAARVLRPGGTLIYDTVNRTWLSRLIYLGAFQSLPPTRIMPRGRYAAGRLRPPSEVAAVLERHGLTHGTTCGFKPHNPLALVKATIARRRGRITDEEIPPLVDFELDRAGPPIVTYLGHARKNTT